MPFLPGQLNIYWCEITYRWTSPFEVRPYWAKASDYVIGLSESDARSSFYLWHANGLTRRKVKREEMRATCVLKGVAHPTDHKGRKVKLVGAKEVYDLLMERREVQNVAFSAHR